MFLLSATSINHLMTDYYRGLLLEGSLIDSSQPKSSKMSDANHSVDNI